MTDLGALPSDQHSEARGSTESGQVVGVSSNPGYPRAFLWEKDDDGTQNPSRLLHNANGINDGGPSLGRSTTSSSTFYGVLWENGGVMPFSSLRPDLFGDSQAWA